MGSYQLGTRQEMYHLLLFSTACSEKYRIWFSVWSNDPVMFWSSLAQRGVL